MAKRAQFGTWDFGLTEEQEQRAAKLHRDSIVIDMLFQGPIGPLGYTAEMRKQIRADIGNADPGTAYDTSLKLPIRRALAGQFPAFEQSWRASGITAGNRQCGPAATDGFALVQAQFDTFDWLIKATTAEHIRTAKREGKHAGFLSTQNTDGIDRELTVLQDAYDFGLRMLGLTYNMQNPVGGGCTERTDVGLSHFGVALVERMDELGVIVDTGHSGRQTTLDACEVSSNPVVASHTAAAAIYEVDRSKSDEEIQAIASTGGVVGVVAVPFFLAPGESVPIEAMLDHIDHIVELVGYEHVGIGTDWPLQADTATMQKHFMTLVYGLGFRPEHNISPTMTVDGFSDYRDFPNITRGLVKRGYSDDQIAAILGGNFLRVFEKVCG